MNEIGNYRNPKIQELLDQLVTEERFGDYKPILDEIIQRRAFQFGFSVNRMRVEIENLLKNLVGFELADENKIQEIGEGTAAAYFFKEKKIYIGAESLKEDAAFCFDKLPAIDARSIIGRSFFHSITHEVYHAIEQHPNKANGIEDTYDISGEVFVSGRGLNEIMIENATTRTISYMTDEERNAGFLWTKGYQCLTNTSAILASIIGTSENDLLSHGLNDVNEFQEFIDSKLPETMDYGVKKTFLTGLGFNADILTSSDLLNRSDLTSSVYAKHFESLIELATKVMSEDQKNPTKENVGAMYYRLVKIASVITSSINDFEKNGFITEEEKNTMLQNQEMTEAFQTLKTIVLDTYKACKGTEMNGMSPVEVEQSLLSDMMQDEEFSRKKNQLYLDDYVQKGMWDNSVFQYSYNVLSNELKAYEQKKSQNKVLDANKATIEQVIENVNDNPNILTGESRRNNSEDVRDDR